DRGKEPRADDPARGGPPVKFTSATYYVFLAAFALILIAFPKRFRPNAALVASYLFYASWRPTYLLVIFTVGVIGHTFAKLLRKAPAASRSSHATSPLSLIARPARSCGARS